MSLLVMRMQEHLKLLAGVKAPESLRQKNSYRMAGLLVSISPPLVPILLFPTGYLNFLDDFLAQ
ncbi:hypothetical protein, partial [Klebsiella grimontii]|uniref:hypothetical protein n=1 Tax=Klebsiella grimontii TaxID=2058152 RepID=UPI001CCE32C6